MNGKTRRSVKVLVSVLVVLSVASYGGLAEPWEGGDLSAFDSADISSQLDNNDFEGLEWADNGTVLFAATKSSAFIYQLEPDEPYSISNLTFVSRKSHPNVNGPNGIELSPDGTKLFLMDAIDEHIERYTLSDPYNLSSATSSPDQTTEFDFMSNANGFAFNEDGTEMVIAFSQTKDSGNAGHLEVWSLDSAYSLSGASQDGSDIVLSHHGQGVKFGDNGTKLYILKGALTGGSVQQYDLPTPYDATTLENGTSHGLEGVSSGTGLDWGDGDGETLFVSEDGGTIHELSTLNHTISGNVVNGSGGGIEGATVTLNTTGATATTNSTGFYQFPVDNGTYQLNATHPDFVENSTTVMVNGSSVTGADITLFEPADLGMEVTNHMFHNQTATVTVTDGGTDVTDNATITSSDTDLITVSGNTLSSTANTSRIGVANITATFDGQTVSKTVAVTDMSASSIKYQQDAGRMASAIWGDVPGPDGERHGGTQLTARIIAVALLVGVPLSRELNGLAGVSGFGITMTAGWFMGWVSLGMVLITGVVCLFIGLNTAQMRARREGPI